jgi:hypothetical protein
MIAAIGSMFKVAGYGQHKSSAFPPFLKGGQGGFSKPIYSRMLPYNKKLKTLARELRKNMTDAEGASGQEKEESN